MTMHSSFLMRHRTRPRHSEDVPYRVGFGSKVVITGDETQKDLAPDVRSGLEVAEKVLGKVEGIRSAD